MFFYFLRVHMNMTLTIEIRYVDSYVPLQYYKTYNLEHDFISFHKVKKIFLKEILFLNKYAKKLKLIYNWNLPKLSTQTILRGKKMHIIKNKYQNAKYLQFWSIFWQITVDTNIVNNPCLMYCILVMISQKIKAAHMKKQNTCSY